MADDNGLPHLEFEECLVQQRGLRLRAPDPAARTLAEAEAGPVEGDDPVIFGEEVEDAAQHEIPRHCPVPVQQHDDRSGAAFDVMQANPVDRGEFALGRVPAFGPSREGMVGQRGGPQHRRPDAENLTQPHGRDRVWGRVQTPVPKRCVLAVMSAFYFAAKRRRQVPTLSP